ncbi:hypothetical protein BD311DRAFT_247430 [Dichomitus squalens]|uniref:Uncharacterized protein n=1 Tax=Dichomitus squalens TaxID=114155 RepID=A0A4V2K0S3_9APHY|nr:hypothetical protein BD311DRAFT_247430 [Dichomitus squalens]
MLIRLSFENAVIAMCAQRNYDAKTKYGVVGTILAVVCFPCGLFALLCDHEKRCVRCGVRVHESREAIYSGLAILFNRSGWTCTFKPWFRAARHIGTYRLLRPPRYRLPQVR